MDPKRKRIYIIIIVVCAVASAGVLLFGRFGGKSTSPKVPAVATSPQTQAAGSSKVTGDAKTGYSVPAVFPANPNFDFSVLDSSAFKQLQSYTPVVNQSGELGRVDPFKTY